MQGQLGLARSGAKAWERHGRATQKDTYRDREKQTQTRREVMRKTQKMWETLISSFLPSLTQQILIGHRLCPSSACDIRKLLPLWG